METFTFGILFGDAVQPSRADAAAIARIARAEGVEFIESTSPRDGREQYLGRFEYVSLGRPRNRDLEDRVRQRIEAEMDFRFSNWKWGWAGVPEWSRRPTPLADLPCGR